MIRKAGRFTGLVLIEAVSAVLIGLTVVVALFLWRLSGGPIQVDFLTPVIEQTLNDSRMGVRVDIGETVLNWGGTGTEDGDRAFDFQAFDIRARDARIYGPTGALIAAVPALGISFDMRELVQGHVQPTVLRVFQPDIQLQRAADGTVDVDVRTGDLPVEHGEVDVVEEVLKALQQPPGTKPGPLSRLSEVRVSGARLTLDDRLLGQVWQAPRGDVILRRDEAGLGGSARLDLEMGNRVVRLDARLRFRSADGITEVTGRFGNVSPADLAGRAPALAALSGAAMVLDGKAELRLDRAFVPMEAQIDVSGRDGTLTLPDFYAEPLKLAQARLRASFDSLKRRVVVDEFTAALGPDPGGPTVSLNAVALDLGNRKLDVTGSAEITGVPIDELHRLWPRGVAANPRGWITENLSAGRAEQARATAHAVIDLDAPDESTLASLDSEIRVKGVQVRYFKELPPVTGVDGVVRISPSTLTVDAEGGQLRDMAVGASKIVITGLDRDDQAIDIATPVSGPLRTALEVLNHKPLGFPDKLGLKPSSVGGSASARLTFKFPLFNSLTVDDIVFGAKGKLSDVSVSGLLPRLPVTKADGELTLDPQKLVIAGNARVNGIPADFSWMESFSSKADILTRITARGVLGDADRERLGFPTRPFLTGPVGLDAVYTVAKPGQGRLAANLDLRDAGMAVELLDWTKRPGMPGTARATLELARGDPVRLSDIALDTSGLAATGAVELAPDGAVRGVTVAGLSLGATRLAGDAAPMAGGGWKVNLSGQSLDLRPLRDGKKGKPADGEDKIPLEVTAAVDRVVLGEGRSLREVSANLQRDPEGWTAAQVNARVGQSGSHLVLQYAPEAAGRRLVLETGDAGAMLYALDLFDNIRGGKLTIVGRTDPSRPGSPLAGRIEMSDYAMVNAPVLARLLNAVSPSGFAELVEGRSLGFSKLTGEFSWEERQEKVRFDDVRTSGSALGLTMEGTIDVGGERADLQGTIVPIYGLNRLLGSIPVLGDILTGGEGQGIFAATYQIQGPLNDPSVRVNPLAVLAPGFLRNLFFLDHDAGTDKSPWVYEYPESD
ncbi:AsmA-like C-terminal domain-containing protein [Skermanella sp. TT6]|uniref:AsmA-like C-terminal domain-containing protein n=1 Tax=Skermanella cutis TaxID=2775420 RepID=A0ABX7B9H6_9PROT|nr:DUF3971 domain-containing protein [Skermanella sp. TT6]QQP90852.1 AsmA-like C-terminal domain-containing protein [Skermanella sp. TT6]